MNIFSRIADLRRSKKQTLPLMPYMLDTPHDALADLTLALAAAVIEAPGVATSSITVTGQGLTVNAVGILPDGRPVRVQGVSLSAAGLDSGTPCALVLTGDAVTRRETVTVSGEVLTHDMQTTSGTVLIIPSLSNAVPADVPAGSILIARFTVDGQGIKDLVPEPRRASLLGVTELGADLNAQLATRYSPSNLVPLSDGYGPDVPIPDGMPWAEHGSFNPRGWFAEFTPDHDCALSGLDDAHQIYSGGQVWRAYVWEVDSSTLLGKSPPADIAAPRVVARFPAPVQMRAGRRYRIGWGGEHSGDVITVTGNRSDVALTYPGFAVSAGAFDNYSNHDNTTDAMPPGGGGGARQSFRLLLASDFRQRGVTGRLTPGALPVSASLLTLADGEGYVYAPAGTPPEWRFKTGGVEYRLPFTAVP